MSFSDHKITAFTHRIADLPDQPNLPADELKERFDSSPEELRESVNGICDDADRLEERVSGIIAETFGDSIDKSMLSDELQDEIDAKAVASTVADQLEAEAAAREDTDSSLGIRINRLESQVPQRAQIYFLSYTGNNAARSFSLSFAPKMVLISCQDYWSASPSAPLAVPQGETVYYNGDALASLSGSTLQLTTDCGHNAINKKYAILALA